MRILLAGATGAIGRRLAPMLVAEGHEVVGTSRTTDNHEWLERVGCTAATMNGLDRASVMDAVERAKPEVVIHQLTALTAGVNLKKFDRDFAKTNDLRTRGTDHLLEAARAVGAGRFVAQSYTGWTNPRDGGPVKDETDPLDQTPAPESQKSLAAIRHVEESVSGADDLQGLVLRYGGLYGPGTGIAVGGELLTMVEGRKLPIVGAGGAVWSFVHIDDAARATLAAVDRGGSGVYNVVDDDPAPVSEWLPYLAEAVAAKPPRRVPAWLAKPLLGEHGVNMMTRARGSSNTKARRELGWAPEYSSWREGFRTGLS